MEDFETYRTLLFSIAYRMTSSASDAEDLVQETYLRAQHDEPGEIYAPKNYFSTILVRLCLDYLKSARVTREQYIGPWLPEPVLTAGNDLLPTETLEQRESISQAFLVLLETLSPPERAVFLLHEVFDYRFQEIAALIDKEPANCRQLFHRARRHIAEGRLRFSVSRDEHKQLVERFLVACQQGDVVTLTRVLSDGVTSWSDSGGKVSAARRPVFGRDAVIRLALGIAKKFHPTASIQIEEVNGTSAALVSEEASLRLVLLFDIVGDRIAGLRTILNPDKLHYIRTQLASNTFDT